MPFYTHSYHSQTNESVLEYKLSLNIPAKRLHPYPWSTSWWDCCSHHKMSTIDSTLAESLSVLWELNRLFGKKSNLMYHYFIWTVHFEKGKKSHTTKHLLCNCLSVLGNKRKLIFCLEFFGDGRLQHPVLLSFILYTNGGLLCDNGAIFLIAGFYRTSPL